MSTTLEDIIEKARARKDFPPPPIPALLRKQAGISQREIGEVCGVTESCISRWEAGLRVPRGEAGDRYVDLINRLAREL